MENKAKKARCFSKYISVISARTTDYSLWWGNDSELLFVLFHFTQLELNKIQIWGLRLFYLLHLQELCPCQIIPQRMLYVGPRVVSLISYLPSKTEVKFLQMNFKDHIKSLLLKNIFTLWSSIFWSRH